MSDRLSHLERLEAESIDVIREVAAECRKPVMLYSIGKDLSVMLHLARKAFFPAPPPFPLMHIDTTWKFRDMIAFRDRMAAESGMRLIVHTNADGLKAGLNPFDHGANYTRVMKTEALKQALAEHGFDAAFGGARRDEEKSRAKERIFSFRSASHAWDPKNQRPELWRLYNTRVHDGELMRVFPLSNWTELDIWSYILREQIAIVPLYFAAPRPTVVRNGELIMVDDGRLPLLPGEAPEVRTIRFRTLGCYPLTGAVESTAASLAEIVAEMLAARTSERGGRLIDKEFLRLDGAEKARGLFLMNKEAFAREAVSAAETADTLRFLTCGSVDDGKSTLIGRLLYDSHLLMEDQLVDLEADSLKHGTAGAAIDFALLVDGLEAEREQGITIDVAYRFFATPRRRFIVADTPGHVQYTRNMATGASTADLAVLLVDATKGLSTQTRRHAVIVSLLGIRQVVLAVNKMDLVGFDAARFREIEAAFRAFAARLSIETVAAIPVSARDGDNVTTRSARTPYYSGPTLLEHLETVVPDSRSAAGPFRMPVQWVCRPNQDFRGFAGPVLTGRVGVGDEVVVAASGRASRVTRILVGSAERDAAVAGQSVMLTLADEIDISRGDVLSHLDARPPLSDQFAADLVWMDQAQLLPGRQYLLKSMTRTIPAQVTELKFRFDVDTLEHGAAKVLELNEIGVVNLSTAEPIAFDPYAENRDTGGFILIDRFSNQTVAAGMIRFALRRASNIHWQALDVDRSARARLKHQKPAVLWFTGLSGSGKSTIANLVEKRLYASGRHTTILDGDNVRHGLNRDLGFTDVDRVENIRRVAETAKLMADAGLIVLVSFISPFRSERDMARGLMPQGEFVEIFVDTPLELCRERDPKGLYARAFAGEIKNFTGVDSPYEAPEAADIHLETANAAPEALAEQVIAYLEAHGRLAAD